MQKSAPSFLSLSLNIGSNFHKFVLLFFPLPLSKSSDRFLFFALAHLLSDTEVLNSQSYTLSLNHMPDSSVFPPSFFLPDADTKDETGCVEAYD